MQSCTECRLPLSQEGKRLKSVACVRCDRLLCQSHMNKHRDRRPSIFNQKAPNTLSYQCFRTPAELCTKGAPRSITNHGALCSYAAVLQCIAVSISSAKIEKCCREVLNLTDDADVGNHFKEHAAIQNSLYEAKRITLSHDDYVQKKATAFLMCLRKLQVAEKTALIIPPILLQKPIDSSADRGPQMSLIPSEVKLSQALPEKMRDAASLFCFFLFLDCNHILDRSSEVFVSAILKIQHIFRGVFFGTVSHVVSLPSGCWLPVVKDHLKRIRKNPPDRPELLHRMLFSLFSKKSQSPSVEIRKGCESTNENDDSDARSVIEWPEILVLHFDRCSAVHSFGKMIKKKITTKVPLPFTFHPFRLGEDLLQTADSPNSSSSCQPGAPKGQYFLQGIVVHEGVEVDDGHFTCFVRRDAKWYYCSDTSYVLCSEDAVDNAEVYMAFYIPVRDSDPSSRV